MRSGQVSGEFVLDVVGLPAGGKVAADDLDQLGPLAGSDPLAVNRRESVDDRLGFPAVLPVGLGLILLRGFLPFPPLGARRRRPGRLGGRREGGFLDVGIWISGYGLVPTGGYPPCPLVGTPPSDSRINEPKTRRYTLGSRPPRLS